MPDSHLRSQLVPQLPPPPPHAAHPLFGEGFQRTTWRLVFGNRARNAQQRSRSGMFKHHLHVSDAFPKTVRALPCLLVKALGPGKISTAPHHQQQTSRDAASIKIQFSIVFAHAPGALARRDRSEEKSKHHKLCKLLPAVLQLTAAPV